MKHDWKVAAIFAAIWLAGCQTTAGPASNVTARTDGPNVGARSEGLEGLPANYRQLVADEVKKLSDHTRGITEAELSEPRKAWAGIVGGGWVPIVCVRYKTPGHLIARGSPLAHIAVAFSGGKVTSTGRVDAPGTHLLVCGTDRKYERFPEIEGKCEPSANRECPPLISIFGL